MMMDEHEQSINEQQELSGEQAAVHMPSEASEVSAGQANGMVSPPSTPPAYAEHLALFEQTAPFWMQPPPPRTYMDPPFYPNPFAPQTEQEVLAFQQYLRQAGYEVEAIDIGFKFRTLVQSSGYEYERVRHELEPVRLQLQEQIQRIQEQLQQEIRQCEAELGQKKTEFVQRMARARLPLPQPDKKSRGNPSALVIAPQLVENALTHDFATPYEICGQHGVTPTGEAEGKWAAFNRIGQWFWELFAPFFAGLILGINIAAITGFLRLEDFRQGRQMWLVALAAFIGFFIEKLVGSVYHHLTSSLAQASEQPFEADEARPFPRLRSTIPLLAFSLFALLLGTAVVVVDALGLRMLHEQAVQQAKLLGAEAGEVLPFWIYLIAGCVISLPYLIYKAMTSWRQSELRLRDARIAYLRWKHIEERRSDPEVQAAFRLAQEVASLQEQLDLLRSYLKARIEQIREEINKVEARLDAARTQAIGKQQEFIQYWDALRDRLIAQRDGVPTGRRGRDIPFNRRAMGEQPDTLLRRLMRALGRG